jgi:hypothetical protein
MNFEREALAAGWARAISDVKARIETLQPSETTLDHQALREFKIIVRALQNPFTESNPLWVEKEAVDE